MQPVRLNARGLGEGSRSPREFRYIFHSGYCTDDSIAGCMFNQICGVTAQPERRMLHSANRHIREPRRLVLLL
jgi:hypothetical protein